MDFDWSEDQIAFRQAVVEFARRDLSHAMVERDRDGTFSRDTWQLCATFGLAGLAIPTEHGGQGADTLTSMLAMEALGYACHDNGLIFSLNAHLWSAAMPIVRFGTADQQDRYLPGLCNGDLIGVQGMTEPETGSDAFSLKTRAVDDGESFVLNGSKTFITNAPVADVFVVFASTDPAMGSFGLSAFLVDRDSPGLSVSEPFNKMGLRTSPMGQLFFDDCTIPKDRLLGKLGNGMAIFNHSIDWERACILASAVGTMQRHVETAVEYANERQQFGRTIGEFQSVSHRIVDMKVRLDAAQLLLYRAGWAKENARRRPSPMTSSMAKLFISEAWIQSSLDLMQVHGGSGYMTETQLERELRDSLASRIYSGTSDIQKNIIAQAIGIN